MLGQPTTADRSQRKAAGSLAHFTRCQSHGGAGYLLRPAEWFFLPNESTGRDLRRFGDRREQRERRLGHRVGQPGPLFREGLDGRNRDPVQIAPLPGGHQPGMGDQYSTGGPVEERAVLFKPHSGLLRAKRYLQVLLGRHPGGARSAVGLEKPRAEALCDRRLHDGQDHHTGSGQ